jgi:hypothetical protein
MTTFDYSVSASSSGFNYEPRVRVWIRNIETGVEIPVFGLIDSGATHTMAHTQIAEILEIPITRNTHTFVGVGGEISGFTHTVGLRLDGEQRVYELNCSFADIVGMDTLLGQDGFFDHFKVSFEKYKGMFSVVRPRINQ